MPQTIESEQGAALLSMEAVARKVCALHNVPYEVVISKRRSKRVSRVRWAVMAALRAIPSTRDPDEPRWSFPAIAGLLGCHHTSVIHGVGRHAALSVAVDDIACRENSSEGAA